MSDGIKLVEAAALIRLPLRLLRLLQKDGIIGEALSNEEIKGLAIIEAMWGREEYVREFTRPLRPARRKALLVTVDLDRVDRYILRCYLNLKEGERLPVQEVINRVQKYLGFRVASDKVRRARQIAYDVRQGKRRQLAEALEKPGKPEQPNRENRTK